MTLHFFRERWLFLSLIIVFVLFKIPHLFYDFYWDESLIYAPSIKLMYQHGPSLFPNAIPTEYSRGHPLLLQFLCAWWMDMFGQSNFTMHCFALAIAVLLAVALFETVQRLFCRRAALVATVLLLMNVCFFYESTFVLNDIMIGLFVLLAIYTYAVEKYVAMAISLTLLIFTKESGLVLLVGMFADVIGSAIQGRSINRGHLLKLVAMAVPMGLFAVFLLVQKKMNGWYLYPLHTSLIDFGFENLMANLQHTLYAIFFEDYAAIVFLLLALLSAYIMVRRWNIIFLSPVIALIVLWVCVFVLSFANICFHLLVFCTVAAAVFICFRRFPKCSKAQERFLKLSLIFTVFFTYFCCVNFFEARYLFPSMLFLAVVFPAFAFDFLIEKISKRHFSVLLAVIIFVLWLNFCYPGQVSPLQYKRMETERQLVQYFEQNNWFDKNICALTYLEEYHLKDPKTGFLTGERPFTKISDKIDSTTEIVIESNWVPVRFEESDKLLKSNAFEKVHRFSTEKIWYIDVYKRKRQ